MTKEGTIEGVIKDILDEEIPDYVQREIASAIKQHYLGKLPKEEVCTNYEGMKLEPRHYRMQGRNSMLADVRKVIMGDTND